MGQPREDFTCAEFDAPAGPLESVLAGIFADVLDVDRVGRGDSFFDLRGTSLQAIRVCTRIERKTGTRIKAAELFAHPAVAELAAWLERDRKVSCG